MRLSNVSKRCKLLALGAAAVLSLPGKYREVMVLYYEQGMRIREIAEALHMPLNSVSSRLRRAKALLRNEVEGGNDA